jgi:hypothetical protein
MTPHNRYVDVGPKVLEKEETKHSSRGVKRGRRSGESGDVTV